MNNYRNRKLPNRVTTYGGNIKWERSNFESSVLLFIGFNYDTHEVKVQNSIKIQAGW